MEGKRQLAAYAPDFDDLDDRFYALEPKEGSPERVMAFTRARPAEFYLDGVVELPVFPAEE